MPTTLSKHGTGTSGSEVTAIGSEGFWLLVDDREYYVPFADYPAFKRATVEQVFSFQRMSLDQFHWPALDIDLDLDALAHPDRYPLVWID